MNHNKDIFIKNIFTTVAPHIDFLSSLFSFGLCHVWRKRTVELSGIRPDDACLDTCTGTGDLALQLMKKIGPRGSLTGVDFCPEMLDIAREKLTGTMNPHPKNVSLEVEDAKRLSYRAATFDLATVAFGMRNIPDTIAALKELMRVLKPGGRFACLELTRPGSRWFLPLYRWYVFHVIPVVGKLVVGTAAPYSYLPVSIDSFYSPEEFRQVITSCGFENVSVHPMTLGIATVFTGMKPHA